MLRLFFLFASLFSVSRKKQKPKPNSSCIFSCGTPTLLTEVLFEVTWATACGRFTISREIRRLNCEFDYGIIFTYNIIKGAWMSSKDYIWQAYENAQHHTYIIRICKFNQLIRYHLVFECWVLSQLFHSPLDCLVQPMVFPVVMYGCMSWTVK